MESSETDIENLQIFTAGQLSREQAVKLLRVITSLSDTSHALTQLQISSNNVDVAVGKFLDEGIAALNVCISLYIHRAPKSNTFVGARQCSKRRVGQYRLPC
jgi:hypothetical protein